MVAHSDEPRRDAAELGRYWDQRYLHNGFDGVSWFQVEPALSLDLLAGVGVGPGASVVDVGGGASHLVDHLVGRNFSDLTVIDVSSAAIQEAKRRVGPGAPVHWMVADILDWVPDRQYFAWHDRAVFHFLVDPDQRVRYRETLVRALAPGGVVVMATFAADGPDSCSGLPTAKYSIDDLAAALGPGFELEDVRRELHLTPGGTVQPFNWIAARRVA